MFDFIANANELLVITDGRNFVSKYHEFNYSQFADDIILYVDKFIECTSYFKNYVSGVKNFAETLKSFSETHVTTGSEFLFEKESKVR